MVKYTINMSQPLESKSKLKASLDARFGKITSDDKCIKIKAQYFPRSKDVVVYTWIEARHHGDEALNLLAGKLQAIVDEISIYQLFILECPLTGVHQRSLREILIIIRVRWD